MSETIKAIEQTLRSNVDENASVQRMSVKLSAYLSSTYDLFKAKVLDSNLVLAMPTDAKADPVKSIQGMATCTQWHASPRFRARNDAS